MATLARKANQFSNLKELEKYIKSHVPENIMQSKDVERLLKKQMYRAVYEIVYKKYTPHTYERRGRHGGLADMRTMEITDAIMKGNTFTMILYNNKL